MDTTLAEQQRIHIKKGNLDKKHIAYYLLSLPSDQLSTLCVTHLMRHLMEEFVNNTSKEAEKVAMTRDFDVEFKSSDVKLPAVKLFVDLGRLISKQIKDKRTTNKNNKKLGIREN